VNEWIEKLAIQEPYVRDYHTIDSEDSDGWAARFTSDGALDFDGAVIPGHV
jgi:hypothetical protein